MVSAEATAKSPDVSNSLPVVMLTLILLLATGLLTRILDLPDSATGIITTAVPAIAIGIVLTIHEIRKSRAAKIMELASGELARNPILVALALGTFLAFVESALGAITGFIVGSSVQIAGNPDALGDAYAAVGPIVIVPLLLLVAFLSSRYASHYLERQKVIWLSAAIAVYILIRLFVVLLASDYLSRSNLAISVSTFLFLDVVMGLLLLFSAWIGSRWARRTHESFVVSRLFRKLNTEDRKAALELLRPAITSGHPSP
jgi:hypothetical protein